MHYLSTVHISQDVQNKIHNLQLRLEQSTDQTKKLKIPISWNCPFHT